MMACTPEQKPQEKVSLSVSKTSLEFTDEGGEQTFEVIASETVYLVPGDKWLKAQKGAVKIGRAHV